MTSYEFEIIAKNAVIKTIKRISAIEMKISDLDFVWFAHELGYKKCTIWGKLMGNKYAEVTYNKLQDELYVDIYTKINNIVIPASEFDKVAHV